MGGMRNAATSAIKTHGNRVKKNKKEKAVHSGKNT
jgi:hypothetical protein